MPLQLFVTTRQSLGYCLDMELLSPPSFSCQQVTYIYKDYLPRDKLTKKHIISVIGSRYTYDANMVELEMTK